MLQNVLSSTQRTTTFCLLFPHYSYGFSGVLYATLRDPVHTTSFFGRLLKTFYLGGGRGSQTWYVDPKFFGKKYFWYTHVIIEATS